MIEVEITARCENCSKGFDETEDMYCSKCYSSLEAEIEDLNNKIGDLLVEIDDLKKGE